MASADQPDHSPPPRAGTDSAGLPALVVVLTALAAGPLVSDALPDGPGGLLRPRGVSVGAGAVLTLWLLLVWPLRQHDRSAASVLRTGLLLVFAGLPVLAGITLVSDAEPTVLLSASGVVLVWGLVAGAYLVGPGRNRDHDRYYAAGVALVVFAGPLVNYSLVEFSGVGGDAGFRVSPLLAIRRILMGLPGADPAPTLLVGLAVGAALLGAGRLGRLGGSAIVFLLIAGAARGDELRVRSLLGDRYVPGRPLPLLVEGAGGTGDATVSIDGAGEFSAPARAGGTLIFVPGRGSPGPLRVRAAGMEREVDLDARAVDPGTPLVVALGTVSPEGFDTAEASGIVITRALPLAATADPLVFLSADGVWDPAGDLPPAVAAQLARAGVPVFRAAAGSLAPELRASASALRRSWEEEGRILGDDGLHRLFHAESAGRRGRTMKAFLLISGFGLLYLTGLRYCAHRRLRTGVVLGGAAALAAFATIALVVLLPALPRYVTSEFDAAEGGRLLRIVRLSARAATVAELDVTGPPLVLGRGEYRLRTLEAGRFKLRVPLDARQSRIVVVQEFGQPPELGPAGLRFGPGGLAAPGEEPLPAGEYLRRHVMGPGREARLREASIRKLLRLADPPEKAVGVRLPTPDRAILEVLLE